MPVIGHAFVGLATAVQYEPPSGRDGRPLPPAAIAFWVPAVVAVAYFPDLVKQIGLIVGIRRAGLIGHSLVVAVVAGALIGAVWAKVSRASFVRLVVVSIGSILVHDALDIVQNSDRAPFWPWSMHTIGPERPLLPIRTISEGMLFLALFAAFLAWRLGSRRSLQALTIDPSRIRSTRLAWTARALVVALVVAAAATQALRASRGRQLNRAYRLMAEARYADAIAAANVADRWPWPTRPGRLDVLRGEAYEALGDALLAERHYLRAYDEDPTNFWAVADLAEFYASCAAPAGRNRRSRAQAYVDELRHTFPRHERLDEVLARVDRRLNAACRAETRGVTAEPPRPSGP
jgi:membrane-bound metal-dependent hydrolase YbcI (DUF457 family)